MTSLPAWASNVVNYTRKLGVRSQAQVAAWVTEYRLRPGQTGSSPDRGSGRAAGREGLAAVCR